MAFLQVNKALIGKMPPEALLAYSIIADLCRLKTHRCYMSQDRFGKMLMLNRKTVGKILFGLENLGLIKCVGYKKGHTIVYECPNLEGEKFTLLEYKLASGEWEKISLLNGKKLPFKNEKKASERVKSSLLNGTILPTSNNNIKNTEPPTDNPDTNQGIAIERQKSPATMPPLNKISATTADRLAAILDDPTLTAEQKRELLAAGA